MKVLIPFSYYYPEHCAGIFVVDDVMHALASQGIESVLYVPTPTRNVPSDVKWKKDEYLFKGKIHIHRFPMYQESNNPALRALRYFFCEIYYLFRMLWDNYDVAFIDSTPPIQGLKLLIVRLFRNKRIIYNAQDLFPETLSGTGLARKGGLLYMIGSLVSKITFRNVDKVIAISNDMKKKLIEEKGLPENKVDVVYNWVDEDAVLPISDEDNPLFDEYSISRDKFRVVYAGNLGNAQNIGVILKAAERFKQDDGVEFIIFGSGGLENTIRIQIKEKSLNNVKLHPLQPFERVAMVYSLGNVCVVSCKKGLGGSVMPSKTCSIMSCERPVLAHFDDGELRRIIEESECGIFTNTDDIEAFVKAISKLKDNPTLCLKMGKNGRNYILDNMTKEVGTKRYVDIIKEL